MHKATAWLKRYRSEQQIERQTKENSVVKRKF